MLEVISKAGDDNIAVVYLAKTGSGKFIEFVESVQPPIPREKKWVLIVSTLYGCPVGCPMCDAGGFYQGRLSSKDILAQIDYLVKNRFPNGKVISEKFKIQFARMGEPALNPAVLGVLDMLPSLYDVKQLIPSVSTVAPEACGVFLDDLLAIKNEHYFDGNFQLQFSIHSTDQKLREKIIPIKKWDFAKIAKFGARFKNLRDQKITLNFALTDDCYLSTEVLKEYFDPEVFLIKITPVNPTINASENNLASYFTYGNAEEDKLGIIDQLKDAGFQVILSIGELEENKIGSNCGQYIKKFLAKGKLAVADSMYTYDVK